MFNEELFGNMAKIFTIPLFRENFLDFFQTAQRDGLEAAKKYWHFSAGNNVFSPNTLELYEKLLDLYMALGFVPRFRFDEVRRENDELRQENKFLKEALCDLQVNIFTEGGEKIQDAWRELADRQLETNKEIGKNFFEFFRQLPGNGR